MFGSKKAHPDGEHRMCCLSAILISGHFVQKDSSLAYEWEHTHIHTHTHTHTHTHKEYDVCLNAVDEVA